MSLLFQGRESQVIQYLHNTIHAQFSASKGNSFTRFFHHVRNVTVHNVVSFVQTPRIVRSFQKFIDDVSAMVLSLALLFCVFVVGKKMTFNRTKTTACVWVTSSQRKTRAKNRRL